jgi:hypothetical protein
MKRTSLLLVAVLLGGCGLFDSGTLWISGPYKIYWIDSPSQSVLGYDLGGGSSVRVAEPCVFGVGENAMYIAFKRVGSSREINVYLLSKSKYDSAHELERALEGPFTQKEYQALMLARSLPAINELFSSDRCKPD